jgi:hypothetical protein
VGGRGKRRKNFSLATREAGAEAWKWRSGDNKLQYTLVLEKQSRPPPLSFSPPVFQFPLSPSPHLLLFLFVPLTSPPHPHSHLLAAV